MKTTCTFCVSLKLWTTISIYALNTNTTIDPHKIRFYRSYPHEGARITMRRPFQCFLWLEGWVFWELRFETLKAMWCILLGEVAVLVAEVVKRWEGEGWSRGLCYYVPDVRKRCGRIFKYRPETFLVKKLLHIFWVWLRGELSTQMSKWFCH